jgi:chromosome segregation ATPase
MMAHAASQVKAVYPATKTTEKALNQVKELAKAGAADEADVNAAKAAAKAAEQRFKTAEKKLQTLRLSMSRTDAERERARKQVSLFVARQEMERMQRAHELDASNSTLKALLTKATKAHAALEDELK